MPLALRVSSAPLASVTGVPAVTVAPPTSVTVRVSPTSTSLSLASTVTVTETSSPAVVPKSGRAIGESLTGLTVTVTVAELKAGGVALLETV